MITALSRELTAKKLTNSQVSKPYARKKHRGPKSAKTLLEATKRPKNPKTLMA